MDMPDLKLTNLGICPDVILVAVRVVVESFLFVVEVFPHSP